MRSHAVAAVRGCTIRPLILCRGCIAWRWVAGGSSWSTFSENLLHKSSHRRAPTRRLTVTVVYTCMMMQLMGYIKAGCIDACMYTCLPAVTELYMHMHVHWSSGSMKPRSFLRGAFS